MKKLSRVRIALTLFVSLALTGCGVQGDSKENNGQNNTTEKSTEIIVSAAASLRASLTELQGTYSQKKPEVKVTLNFGGSGTLQQQVEQGAPADLFISAGKTQVDNLVKKNLLINDSIVNLLGNELVLITQKDNQKLESIQDLKLDSSEEISIGTPETVPAGKYAMQSLTTLNLWDDIQPKLVLAKDVNQVLSYVETNNVDAGIVYKSDTLISDKVKIVETIPNNTHDPKSLSHI